jgi:hypothetical protein
MTSMYSATARQRRLPPTRRANSSRDERPYRIGSSLRISVSAFFASRSKRRLNSSMALRHQSRRFSFSAAPESRRGGSLTMPSFAADSHARCAAKKNGSRSAAASTLRRDNSNGASASSRIAR